MPRIDDGPTDGPPGRGLQSAWVTLSLSEAKDPLESLQSRYEAFGDGVRDRGWHTHVTDADGNELTVAIELEPHDQR